MDNSSEAGDISIMQQFGHISDEESLRIADSIDSELLPFFNKEVIQEKETNVIAVERKGLNLFHPYLASIKGMRSIVTIKPLNHRGPYSMEYHFRSAFHSDNSNILLTDAITTGTEARNILRLSPFKFKFLGGYKKVCGYMAVKETLDKMEREFPHISFRILKVFEGKEEYFEERKKIIYVYQKRMEPIDEEHEFFVIDVIPGISIDELKSRITELFRKKYGDYFELIDNELGIGSTYNFTIYFDNPLVFLKSRFNVCLQEGDIIEKLAIRFKYSSKDAKLRIMALSLPNLNKEKIIESIRRRLLSTCSRNVPKKHCRMPMLAKIFAPFTRSALCADCIDTNVSKTLLGDIYSLISEAGLIKAN